jgi:hypothetical protein
MADDYVIEAAKELARQRRQNKKSFFPAADAINSTPQGQVIIPQGGSQNFHALPPDQNPAYQAAIAKGRPDMGAYTWITTPSGGQMRVPTNFALKPKTGTALEGSSVNPATGPLSPDQYAAAYNRGFGAPAPSFNPETGTLASKGVETPVEALTIAQRSQIPGSNPFLEQWGANFAARNPRLGALGNLAVKTFSGVRGAFNGPAVSQYVNNVSTGQLPPVPTFRQQAAQSQNFYNYNPSPAPPRRYSDLGYY